MNVRIEKLCTIIDYRVSKDELRRRALCADIRPSVEIISPRGLRWLGQVLSVHVYHVPFRVLFACAGKGLQMRRVGQAMS